MIARCINSVACILILCLAHSAKAAIIDVNIGPTTNTLWIDQSRPIPGRDFYQKWGMVITAPDEAAMLRDFTLNPIADMGGLAATNFGISIYNWSQALHLPMGAPLYISPFSPIGLTTFLANIHVNGGAQYLITLNGNGSADFPVTNASDAATLYLLQTSSSTTFNNTPYALQSRITYETLSPVPLPPSWVLFLTGILAIVLVGRLRNTQLTHEPLQ